MGSMGRRSDSEQQEIKAELGAVMKEKHIRHYLNTVTHYFSVLFSIERFLSRLGEID